MTYLPIEFHKPESSPKLPADFCARHENAWTIPASFYTSETVYRHEEKKIFEDTWICVAHRSEVANANAYITRDVVGESILVVRGKDKVLRAFYNVCPHRGHQLLEGSGQAKNVITCPYHAWAFKLDGALAHANNCDHVESFDKDKSSLMPVSVEEYAGFVFINLNPQASNVEAQLPGLEASLRKACPVIDDLKLAARFVSETPANWKSIVDNYLECYHCGPAHPGFSDSVQVDRYTHSLHGNWTLQFGHAKSSERSFKLDPAIKDPSFHGYWAWPCTMFNVPPGSDFMTVIYEFPMSAEVTLQHYDIYFLNEEPTAEQQKLIEWYRTVFRPEDLRLVESVQKGLKSRGYRGQGRIMVDEARSGISEHGIAHFHHLLAQQYQD
ncbi:aromatic ring-hydroxylating oxygenase subunit alpha [Paraburkholderia acidisoli]|uniref:Carnitine monooxygenase oxygenase subunit n=1 Tax=Paraburkholderia acidisoli TaxID=2571748 RepID=A0A7Z2GRQ6_9BURK|nr:ring-hydroxylating oxygenase subunit alpha [Paraburkholderia acidisoli]QGZ66708.1 Rieske 2Fe-2S domain-containing protein [Paraburkholderia acidisoli]